MGNGNGGTGNNNRGVEEQATTIEDGVMVREEGATVMVA